MANNQYVNKVVYGSDTLIDLTQDTVTQSDVLTGKYVHLPSGERVQGTCTYDADTSDANAAASEILAGKSAYVNGNKITGTMINRGMIHGFLSTKDQIYTIPIGFYDGSNNNTVSIDSTEQEKIIAGNIKAGVEILGVTGSYSGESVNVQSNKTVTSSAAQQVVLPDSGYDYLAQVTVNAMPYVETDNPQGGKTVTIG